MTDHCFWMCRISAVGAVGCSHTEKSSEPVELASHMRFLYDSVFFGAPLWTLRGTPALCSVSAHFPIRTCTTKNNLDKTVVQNTPGQVSSSLSSRNAEQFILDRDWLMERFTQRPLLPPVRSLRQWVEEASALPLLRV